MRRLWILVALLLSLLPSPAAASECAPAPGEDRYRPAPWHDAGDQVRAGAGFELLTQREQGRGEGRGLRSVLPDPMSAGTFRLLPPPAPVRRDVLPPPEGSTPLCEHLPYHATAPPTRG